MFICVPLNYNNICWKYSLYKTEYLFSQERCQNALSSGSDISHYGNNVGCVSSSIAEHQGMKRGWFTYTDLCVLMEQSAWSQALTAIYQHFTKVRKIWFFNVSKRITHVLTVLDVFKVCIDHHYMLNVSFVFTERN